jgi:arsenate reductase
LGKAGTRLHWPFDDPAGAAGSEEEKLRVFRRVRDEIKTRLDRFIDDQAE